MIKVEGFSKYYVDLAAVKNLDFEVKPGDAYDSTIHQVENPKQLPPEGQPAVIEATLATGYTFQGKPIRKPLIALKKIEPKAPQTGPKPTEASNEPIASPAPPAPEKETDKDANAK